MLMDTTLLARRDSVIRWFTGSTLVRAETEQDQGVITPGVPAALFPLRYDYIKYTIGQLPTVSSLPGRKFIYAHIFSTHTPYVFAQDGSYYPDESIQGYLNGTIYTNGVILDAVDQILENSNPDPIIIIQGDHGRQGSSNKFGILNAYHLPDGGNEYLYSDISPINSFRLIFNIYFGAHFKLLDDLSYSWSYVDNNITFTQQFPQSSCH